MKKTLRFFICISALTSCLCAEEFYLKDKSTGRVYGPFSTETGSKVDMGRGEFTVVEVNSEATGEKREFEEPLKDYIITEVDMRNAPLEEVVNYVVQRTREQDPKGVGINIVIAKAPEPEAPPVQEERPDPFGFGTAVKKPAPGITLKLREVSVLQFLESLMELTGYSYKLSGNVVTISPK